MLLVCAQKGLVTKCALRNTNKGGEKGNRKLKIESEGKIDQKYKVNK